MHVVATGFFVTHVFPGAQYAVEMQSVSIVQLVGHDPFAHRNVPHETPFGSFAHVPLPLQSMPLALFVALMHVLEPHDVPLA